MSHDLNVRDGKAAMMYVGEPPWHGLGTKLDNPATSREAITAAGLDWEVGLLPVYATEGDTTVRVPRRHAVVRSDLWGSEDCPILGVVAPGYVPLQNKEAFEFFDSIVGKGSAVYHTAGALGRGERVWMLAKLPGQMRIVKDDVADKFLLLSTGHNGRTSVQIKFTPVRVVCQNTLTLALRRGQSVSVAHDRRLHAGLHDAKSLLGLVNHRFSEMETTFQRFAQVRMNSNRLDNYLKLVYPLPRLGSGPRVLRRVLADRSDTGRIFECGVGLDQPGVKGTLWAAYNAVTEYVDHHRCGYCGERRLRSIWFGRGCNIKMHAHAVAGQLVGTWSN